MAVRVACMQECLKGGGCTKKAPIYISTWANNEVAESSKRATGTRGANFDRGRHKVLAGCATLECLVYYKVSHTELIG